MDYAAFRALHHDVDKWLTVERNFLNHYVIGSHGFHAIKDKYMHNKIQNQDQERLIQELSSKLYSNGNELSYAQSIINWFPFKENATCLEIGGGCGAITGALCQNLHEVKVVELSKRRSSINLARHKHFDNLEIIVGNLNDIEFKEKFDYITLIGDVMRLSWIRGYWV